MTDFTFEKYLEWISKDVHFYKCNAAPNNDTNINHASLEGDRLNHPRIFRNTGTQSRLLNDVDRGGIECPSEDYTSGIIIYVLHTDRFKVGDEIYIEDDNSSEIAEISAITTNLSITVASG